VVGGGELVDLCRASLLAVAARKQATIRSIGLPYWLGTLLQIHPPSRDVYFTHIR